MQMWAALLIQLTFQVVAATATFSKPTCKCNPTSSCWPSLHEWDALNKTVNGNLLKPLLPANVCYAGPTYNEAACAEVTTAFTTQRDSFVYSDPVLNFYWNVAGSVCVPTSDPANGTCEQGAYPVYVVNVSSTADVQAGINFARENNVRLVVKNTGHDFLGRSVGYGSLSIWTHHLRDVEYIHDFKPTGCRQGHGSAVRVGSGTQFSEIAPVLEQYNQTMVMPFLSSIGIAGWALGGGHGPISGVIGLGADQIVELEIVTPDGQVRIANECQNPDLFFALRGSGSSTYGVVTKITSKTFPAIKPWFIDFQVNQRSNASDVKLWQALAEYYDFLPDSNDHGLVGLHAVSPSTDGLSLRFQLLSWKDTTVFEKYLTPYIKRLNTSVDYFGEVSVAMTTKVQLQNMEEVWEAIIPFPNQVYFTAVSRLFDKRAVLQDSGVLISKLNESLTSFSSNDQITSVLGLQICGPGVRAVPDLPSAVNPSWRKCYLHETTFGYAPATNRRFTLGDFVSYEQNKARHLYELAPNMGNYPSESSIVQQDFTRAFWGTNYPRLLALKKQWDPQGVFYCRECVGSEYWMESPEGTLCPLQSSEPFNSTWLDLPYMG